MKELEKHEILQLHLVHVYYIVYKFSRIIYPPKNTMYLY